ncbi:MAG TPA: ABC transporter permease [Candidatus Methylomirabilis sp.]|nr:ABC transporter permease [Candidatus Methylomirabilis sp.]
MTRRLVAMIRKELAQLLRDVPLVLVLLWAFGGSIYVHGHGVSTEIFNYPVVILDLSRSPASREFVARLHAPYFKIVGFARNDRDVVEALDLARASLAVVIPPDFERLVRSGQGSVQVISDGTLSTSAAIAGAHLATITDAYNQYLLAERGQPAPRLSRVDARVRVAYNPNETSAWFSSVLELLNMTTEVSILLTAAALVREKERGTLDQLLVTPLRPAELFAAKIAPTIIVVVPLSLLALLAIIRGAFHTPIQGSLVLFYAVTVVYVFTIAGLGLTIAVLVKNVAQAMMLLVLILFPMLFLSGARNPAETMEPWMRYVSLVSPMRYYIDFGYQVLFKGNGIAYVWKDLVGILGIGGLMFWFAVVRFRHAFHR